MKKPKLSVIILNHNTNKILSNCLDSIKKYIEEVPTEVIVSDNDSTDGSVENIRKNYKWVKLLEGPNISFSNGNNRAMKLVHGEYILFLNSDTLLQRNVFKKTIEYMDANKKVGALTCKLVMANGDPDKDARRRFPTPWISLNRLFLKNGKKYWYLDQPVDKTQKVEAIEGAFFLTRKFVLDEVGWFDENYYFDGEDLDLCYQIKKLGYEIIYYPEVSIVHLKAVSKKLSKISLQRRMEGVNSMEYFYRKNLWNSYPMVLNIIVLIGIRVLKFFRYLESKLT